MNNKNAISAVVATVLIILITVAAVTIIWAAVIPMIKENTLGGTTCLDAVSQVSLETDGGYTCKDTTSVVITEFSEEGSCLDSEPTCDETDDIAEVTQTALKIQVSHGAKDFALDDIKVLTSEAGNTESLTVKLNATDYGAFPGANEVKVYTINLTGNNKDPDEVSIAPMVAVGNTQKECEISSTVTLQEC